MRRPPARRPRVVALGLLTTLAAACAREEPAQPTVVEIAAQPCASPNRSQGLGVVVAGGVVATAGHTVEGALRELTVDGAPARVLVLDHRTDLALLAVETDAEPAALSEDTPERATLLRPGRRGEVGIIRTGMLAVDDTTDRRRYERQVHTFTPGVEDGTSGAPLIDDRGRVLGVVVLDNPERGVAYAVSSHEISRLLATADELLSTGSGQHEGENPCEVRSSGT